MALHNQGDFWSHVQQLFICFCPRHLCDILLLVLPVELGPTQKSPSSGCVVDGLEDEAGFFSAYDMSELKYPSTS